LSIKTAAGFTPGETVLIQGATGVAGRLAVKVARLLGAGRIVATGRNDDALREVQALGADTVINTAVSDDELAGTFTASRGGGYDIVLDYLWGRPTEVLLRTLVPSSFAFPKPTRLIQVGESAGPESLPRRRTACAASTPPPVSSIAVGQGRHDRRNRREGGRIPLTSS